MYSLFYFIARLRRRSSANGTQPNFAKWWTVNLVLKVGVVPPKNWGQKLYTFGRFSTSSRLNFEYLRNKTWYRQSGKKLETTRSPLHCIDQRFKMRPSFLSTLYKFCIKLHCQALHTKVSKQNSTKPCNMLGSEPDLQMHVKNLKGSPHQKLGS